ncbi:PACE efflux transporter [Pontibacterium sp.]|uniref:PACE efflux transporter n=1 Tax=Pontibacterium sp. TaxID=2036026 RepID=UPI0035613672
MRTTKDRIRHTLLFEAVALVLSTAVAALVLENSVTEIGSLAIILSLIAMGWNYQYNLWFDCWQHHTPPNKRSLKLRLVHIVGFEGGLLIATLPLVAWWLNMPLWHAFLTDMGFTLFFMVYAFAFNWAYDLLFPVNPQRNTATVGMSE